MATKKKASKATGSTNPLSGKRLIAADPTLTEPERAVVRTVQDFEVAEKTITLFEEEHADVFGVYKQLIEERNQKLQAAETAVRGLDVSCGPFDRYTESILYDAAILFQHLGSRAKFLEVGGSINTETVYSIDRERVEVAIKTGAIPANVVPAFKKVSSSYHTPKLKI